MFEVQQQGSYGTALPNTSTYVKPITMTTCKLDCGLCACVQVSYKLSDLENHTLGR
jgi:hypothetical protein